MLQKDQRKGFLRNLFLVGKRDGDYRTVINQSKGTKQTYFLPIFKDESFTLSKINVTTGRLHVQARLRRCLLFSPI